MQAVRRMGFIQPYFLFEVQSCVNLRWHLFFYLHREKTFYGFLSEPAMAKCPFSACNVSVSVCCHQHSLVICLKICVFVSIHWAQHCGLLRANKTSLQARKSLKQRIAPVVHHLLMLEKCTLSVRRVLIHSVKDEIKTLMLFPAMDLSDNTIVT